MIGWLIAAAAVVLAHKSQAASTATPATHIVVGPVPQFGNSSPSHSELAPSREPLHMGLDLWQNGPPIPIATGARQDVLPKNPSAVSDSVNNQLIQVEQFISGAPNVRNPTPTGTGSAAGGASSGGSGAGAPATGTGGGTSFGGGGGFGGRRALLQ